MQNQKLRISTSGSATNVLIELQLLHPHLSVTQIANVLLSEIPKEELVKCLKAKSQHK